MNRLRIDRKTINKDITAGLTAAVAAIPDGMATASLAGVSPIYGLYNLMVGTPIASIFTSSVYMAVINASAMAYINGLNRLEYLKANPVIEATAVAV